MADEKTTTTAPVNPADVIGTFDQILYWIYVSTDDFDLPAFRNALPASVRQRENATVSLAPRDAAHGSYHAFFAWAVNAEEVTLTIDYHDGPMEHSPDEHEPYAEDLIRWLGKFFNTDSVIAHAHARLRYSTATHRSRMPLSLAVDAPGDAELYGIALRLRKKPNGTTSVRLTRGQSYWYAEAIGERNITFNISTPVDDVIAFRDVLAMFIEESSA